MMLVSYLGFEYEGPGVAEMFTSFNDEEMTQIKDDLELLIFHKWSVNNGLIDEEGEVLD